jgi:peptidoglycan/LPS O-acetylase OafA/YrhL
MTTFAPVTSSAGQRRAGDAVTAPPETASPFRRDIQGLRAIAVLTVIAAHARPHLLDGGFVGVDVFFVISGFLITQQLVGEAERSGNATLAGFYSRRARRILPAATVVLIATVVASTLFVSFLHARTIVVDAMWAAGFGANLRFAQSGVDYFASDQPPSPVQHFWSLSVEEQFYLVWPLVVIGVVFLAGRWSRRAVAGRTERRGGIPVGALLAVIIVLSAASFAWSLVDTANSPATAYFSTFTRAWELGLGAAAALVAHRVPGWLRVLGRVRWLTELVAAAGIAAIAWACLRLDSTTPFPGAVAAVPVLGATVVLLVGAIALRQTWTARLLSLRPARIVGDWSYSLYLWHWPILILGEEHLRRALTATETTALVAVTFVLAGLTYHFVETPFRAGAGWSVQWLRPWTRPPRALVLYPASLVLVVGSAFAANGLTDYRQAHRPNNPPVTLPDHWRSQAGDDLGKQPEVALVRRSVWAAEHGMGVPKVLHPSLDDVAGSIGDVGECDYNIDVTTLCPRGDPNGSKTLVVVGNSHGRHWISAFEKIAQHAGYRAYYLVRVQCTVALVTLDNAAKEPDHDCAAFPAWAIDQVRQLKPDLVVVSSTGTDGGVYRDDGTYVTDQKAVTEAIAKGFGDLFQQLRPLTDRLVLLDDIPRVHGIMSDCLASYPRSLGECLSWPYADRAAQTRAVGKAADALGVERIRTDQWFCARGKCPAVVGDIVSYRDTSHMTNEYAESLAQPLGEALRIW